MNNQALKKEVNDSYKQASDTAKNLADQSESGFDQIVTKAKAQLEKVDFGGRLEDIQSQAQDRAKSALNLVKKYPVYATVGAIAVGVVAGILISRKSRD